MSPSNGNGNGSGGGNGANYIEHQVSKLDTLAGVAIKYGVEVADIKRINGLATDFQMFALKTLQIPLPGRHPPSPLVSNGSASPGENSSRKAPPCLGQSNMLGSLQSLRVKAPQKRVSPAMSTLQNYYNLKSPNFKGAAQGTEMTVYKTERSDFFDDGLLPKASPISDTPSNCCQNSRNSDNGYLPENGVVTEHVPCADPGDGDGEKSDEKYVRRRSKPEVDTRGGTPERLLNGENSGGSSGFSVSMGKGLAMRPKSASRTTLVDSESGWLSSIPVVLGDSIIADGPAAVRKSSSTSSLKDQETNTSTSAWPTSKWSLKTDLQALSAAAITRPIFDGLPKPICGRRNKAALD
ncbi:uncharacterized protein LOC121244599 isoform X2 [Juglans microcarpa x Juglans regia]|uniref:uncharacterized protein LOC121244599 isoform X2 n=1 Tax=Juglans microcarpa x Juglans regia TaxID=2249226 RepID=UPI001B7F1E17|nr:uncharacterized protein LOC121244599 isoform X2 [Juglans microcarpa x Juglans regia]